MTTIRTQTPPNIIGQPFVNLFEKDAFETLLWQKGYDVILEEAVRCPCKGISSDNKPSCLNCLGSGWFFVNPIKTKAHITSINKNTKYKDWSPEMVGTAAMTFMDVNRIGFMDKITFSNNYSTYSEILEVKTSNTSQFVFCSYKPTEIKSIFIYNTSTTKPTKLTAVQYSVSTSNPYVINLTGITYPTPFNGCISVSYKHNISYNVLDIPHDVRITIEQDMDGKMVKKDMPIQAISRKSHYEIGSPTKFDTNNLLNNSWLG